MTEVDNVTLICKLVFQVFRGILSHNNVAMEVYLLYTGISNCCTVHLHITTIAGMLYA